MDFERSLACQDEQLESTMQCLGTFPSWTLDLSARLTRLCEVFYFWTKYRTTLSAVNQIKEKLPSYFNLEANMWECTKIIERSFGYLWLLLFMRFTRRLLVFHVRCIYLVSISLIFCTLFAKDASIQTGISLLLVLQHDLPSLSPIWIILCRTSIIHIP